MANKKIKHIVAKLLGATTEETLDIYDESALHATDIVDNLTSTDATKVLSAKQGKALNDSITSSLSSQSSRISALEGDSVRVRDPGSTSNANSFRTPGWYYKAGWTNTPSTVGATGYLLVLGHYSSNSFAKQFYTTYSHNVLFMRTLNDGSWNSWSQITVN